MKLEVLLDQIRDASRAQLLSFSLNGALAAAAIGATSRAGRKLKREKTEAAWKDLLNRLDQLQVTLRSCKLVLSDEVRQRLDSLVQCTSQPNDLF